MPTLGVIVCHVASHAKATLVVEVERARLEEDAVKPVRHPHRIAVVHASMVVLLLARLAVPVTHIVPRTIVVFAPMDVPQVQTGVHVIRLLPLLVLRALHTPHIGIAAMAVLEGKRCSGATIQVLPDARVEFQAVPVATIPAAITAIPAGVPMTALAHPPLAALVSLLPTVTKLVRQVPLVSRTLTAAPALSPPAFSNAKMFVKAMDAISTQTEVNHVTRINLIPVETTSSPATIMYQLLLA